MLRALWTSASGLISHQIAVDTIANNVSNVNSTSFKRNTVKFEDLFYQKGSGLEGLGEFEPDFLSRTNVSFGTGVSITSTSKLFTQGRLEPTGNTLDLAIEGKGFFRVQLPDGTYAYTRDGSFKIDSTGQVVTAQGYKLDPSLKIPEGAKDIVIEKDGLVKATLIGSNEPSQIGQINIFVSTNLSGLSAIGENLYVSTEESGDIVESKPSDVGVGTINQGFLEGSNVDLATEMTELVIAQRSYQLNARAFKNAEEMIAVATNIRG